MEVFTRRRVVWGVFNTCNVSCEFDRRVMFFMFAYVCLHILSMFYLCIQLNIDHCWKKSTFSEDRLIKLGHVSLSVCYSMCCTLYKKTVKRQFDIFVWVCACPACVIMCFYQSIVPFKQEYEGRTRGRVIQFIKKKTIPQCHWFHFVLLFITMYTVYWHAL